MRSLKMYYKKVIDEIKKDKCYIDIQNDEFTLYSTKSIKIFDENFIICYVYHDSGQYIGYVFDKKDKIVASCYQYDFHPTKQEDSKIIDELYKMTMSCQVFLNF